MNKSLIRKNQLHPDISDLVGQYGSGYFISSNQSSALSGIVYITGDQTIDGVKTFNSNITIFGTNSVGNIKIVEDYLGGEIGILSDLDEAIAIKMGDGTYQYGGGNFGEAPLSILNGVVNFTNRPNVNGTGVLLQGEAAAGSVSNVVYTTGNQTISGVKIFQGNGYYYGEPSISQLIINSTGSVLGEEVYGMPLIEGGPSLELKAGTASLILNQDNIVINSSEQFYLSGGPLILVNPQYISLSNGPLTIQDIQSLSLNVRPTVNGTGVLLSGEAAQVDLSSTVRTTGNQTISGTKTFVTNSLLYSGVNVNFDSNTNVKFSGQVSFSNDRSWTTGISLGNSSYTIPYYDGSFSSIPKVLTTIEVTGSTVFNHNIKNRTTSQFTLLFPSTLTENVTLNVRAVL